MGQFQNGTVAGGTMSQISDNLIKECRQKLLQTKADILNRVKDARGSFQNDDKGGDEADQTVRVLAEQELLAFHDRMRSQLAEIDNRIENGSFGVC